MSRRRRSRRRSEPVYSRALTVGSGRNFLSIDRVPLRLRSPLVVRRFASEPRRISGKPRVAAAPARRSFINRGMRSIPPKGRLSVVRVRHVGVTQQAANVMRKPQYALLDRRTGQVVPKVAGLGLSGLMDLSPIRELKAIRGPHDLKVCLRRRARREVLFARGGTSARARKRRTLDSTVEC